MWSENPDLWLECLSKWGLVGIDCPFSDRLLGIKFNEHGKMPDMVIHFTQKNWLIVIEAVTSHGPINIKRHNELKALFASSKIELVYVTAFDTRSTMMRYINEIAWETEIWIADQPSHMIHLNGERFMGPYKH